MRTTLTIDDEVYIKVKHLAETKNMALGEIVSETLKKGLESKYVEILEDDFPVIPMKPDARMMTLEMVNEIRDQED